MPDNFQKSPGASPGRHRARGEEAASERCRPFDDSRKDETFVTARFQNACEPAVAHPFVALRLLFPKPVMSW
jgi:hypothetical protein